MIYPSPSEIIATHLPLCGYGLGEAQVALRDVLRAQFPGIVAAFNSARGLTGNDALPIPRAENFEIAPAVIDQSHAGKILIGASTETTPQGIGGAFKNEAAIAIYTLDIRATHERLILQHWQRAELIKAALHPLISGWEVDGQIFWRSLTPTGYSMLPGDWATEFSGVGANFRMIISPRVSP